MSERVTLDVLAERIDGVRSLQAENNALLREHVAEDRAQFAAVQQALQEALHGDGDEPGLIVRVDRIEQSRAIEATARERWRAFWLGSGALGFGGLFWWLHERLREIAGPR